MHECHTITSSFRLTLKVTSCSKFLLQLYVYINLILFKILTSNLKYIIYIQIHSCVIVELVYSTDAIRGPNLVVVIGIIQIFYCLIANIVCRGDSGS